MASPSTIRLAGWRTDRRGYAADDASITLSSTINEGALISVHHNTLGAAVLFYVTFASVAQIISDSSSLGSATDTDGKMCMI